MLMLPFDRYITLIYYTIPCILRSIFSLLSPPKCSVAPQLLTTSNFIGPWYHAALLFSGLGSIVLLFGVLFSQQIREDLVRAATSRLLRKLNEHISIIQDKETTTKSGKTSVSNGFILTRLVQKINILHSPHPTTDKMSEYTGTFVQVVS